MAAPKRHRKLEIPGFFAGPPELHVTFEGKRYSARAGETLAHTLLAHGVYVVGRSPKYHRPRGVFCGRGSCGQCGARIDGRPNLKLCTTPAHDGAFVESQNAVGTARFDLLSTIDWLFPGGLDHHRLMTESTTLNRVAISMARELGGLGALPDPSTPAIVPQAEKLETTVAVIGGGAAGAAAAEALRQAGVDSLVIDPRHGVANDGIDALAIGFYDDRGVVATSGDRVWRVRADAIILAMGAYEQLPPIPANDLPGLFARRAVELALERGILPGRRLAVVLDPSADAALRQRALELTERLAGSGAQIELALGLGEVAAARRSLDGELGAVEGRSRVRHVRVDGDDSSYDCDAVVWCGRPAPAYEMARQMGVPAAFSPAAGGFVPEHDDVGRASRRGLYLAGELAGTGQDEAAADGRRLAAVVVADLQQGHRLTEAS